MKSPLNCIVIESGAALEKETEEKVTKKKAADLSDDDLEQDVTDQENDGIWKQLSSREVKE